MPRETREERRARRARIAAQWAAWLKDALAHSGMSASEMAARSTGHDAAFQTGHVTHWTKGDNTASAEAVLLIARILERNPVEALRAAGHHDLADQIVEIVEEALRGERLLEQGKYDKGAEAM